MLTAHLPSGYILGKQFNNYWSRGFVFPAAVLGAIVPDLDMLYFYFVDFGRTHHHMFVSHWPLFWLSLGVLVISLMHFARWTALRNSAIAFFLAALLHCVLDSIAAPMFWLMPFMEGRVELVTVPAAYGHWIISYLLHWTFALELAIWFVALFMFRRARF